MTTSLSSGIRSDPHVFLIGRPPISELLGFIRNMAVDGQSADLGALTAKWRAANDHVLQLEKEQAGAADAAAAGPIPGELAALAQPLLADPVFRRAYRFAPTDLAIVDLDRLVVFQKYINLAFVEELKARLGPAPTPETILRFALLDRQDPQFQFMQSAPTAYTFISRSTDFRFLEPQFLDPSRVPAFESTGHPVAILGLAVGYGSNFLNVINIDNRLVLGNGSHRAYALRDLGVTQVPALVQRLTRREELELVASGDFASNPDRYLKTLRPPMLRDYFDDRLRMVVPVYRKSRSVRVQFAFEATDIPAE